MSKPSISSKQRFGLVQPFPQGKTAGHTGIQQFLNLISAEVSSQQGGVKTLVVSFWWYWVNISPHDDW